MARYGLRSPAALRSGHSWALSKCLEGPSARQQERIHLDRRHKVGEGGDQEVLRRSPSLQTARLYAYFRSVCSSKSSWRHIQLFHRLLGVHLHCATVPRYWYFIPTGLEQHVEFAIVIIIFAVLMLFLFSIMTKSNTVYTNNRNSEFSLCTEVAQSCFSIMPSPIMFNNTIQSLVYYSVLWY